MRSHVCFRYISGRFHLGLYERAYFPTITTLNKLSTGAHIQAFEAHVESQDGFNEGKRERRQWQDGKNPHNMETYTITSKLFTRRSPFNLKGRGEPSVPYTIHPWILQVSSDPQSRLTANPEQPQYYDSTEGSVKKLEDCADPRFKRNNIICVTCRLGFIIFGDNWWPEITPLELVRVDRLPKTEGSEEAPWYPPIAQDFTPLELGVPLPSFDGRSCANYSDWPINQKLVLQSHPR